MNFLDIFTDPLGYKGINKQRRAADRYAKKMYDPKIFNPMVSEAQQQASEGVDDASMRVDYLRRLFAQQPQGQFFGGNQAAYVSGMNALASNMAGSQAGAELQIGMAEEQAKRTARNTLAELFSKQKQTQAQQEAALEENAMMAQAEKNRRFNEFMGGLTDLATTAVGVALAPATGGTSLMASAALAGKASGTTMAGIGLGSALGDWFGKTKNFIGGLFGGNNPTTSSLGNSNTSLTPSSEQATAGVVDDDLFPSMQSSQPANVDNSFIEQFETHGEVVGNLVQKTQNSFNVSPALPNSIKEPMPLEIEDIPSIKIRTSEDEKISRLFNIMLNKGYDVKTARETLKRLKDSPTDIERYVVEQLPDLRNISTQQNKSYFWDFFNYFNSY